MKANRLQPMKALIIWLTLVPSGQIYAESDFANLSIIYSLLEADKRSIYLGDESGRSRVKVVDHTDNDGYPSVSPDGKRLAFYGKYDDNKTWSIHTVNIGSSNVQRLTYEKHVWDSAPTWSPDGKTIVFAREYDDSKNGWQEEIWQMNADGTNQRQIENLEGRAPYFLQDGRILFHTRTGPSQICIAHRDGSNIVQLTVNDANDWSPKISPDGTEIIFISDRDGNREIYTVNIDGTDQTRITFNDVDDWDPAWSADGAHLFFASENSDGGLDIYIAKRDGTSLERILDNALQISTVMTLDRGALERLVEERQ